MEEKKRLFSHVEEKTAIPRARLFTRIEEKVEEPGTVERVEESEPGNFQMGSFISNSAEGMNVRLSQPSGQAEIFPIEQVISNTPKVLETIRQMPERKQKINIDAASFSYFDGSLFANDGETTERVGNFALQIIEEKREVQEIVNEANEETGVKMAEKWKLKINVANKAIFEGNVEGSRLFDFDWIEKISQNRAALSSNHNAKKLLKKYLHSQIEAEQHSVVEEYASSGWKWWENGQVFYLTSQGAIGMNHLRIKAAKGFELLTKPADQRQILREFLEMRAIIPGNQGNAVFLQSYTIAALLTALFKRAGHQIEFCTALIGKTNTKKTSCGEVFTRVFNRTPSAVPEINFAATEAAIYEIMDRYSDTIVMIDDLTPSENDMDAREKRRKLESIIRAYGDRVPRRRSVAFASNSTVKEFTPINGCALITGETFSGGKSSRSRVVVLNFEEGDVSDSVLSYYQANLHTLPNFVNDFLQYVTGRIEQVMQIIEFECAQARQNVKNAIKLPRFIDAYGVLCAATGIFAGYITENALMSREEVQKLIAGDRELLLQIIMGNDAAVSNISPGIMILEALKFAVERQQISIRELSEITEENPGNYLIYDENFLYTTSEKLWECCRKYADYRKTYFPYKSGRELITPLKEENLILLKREGRSVRASHKITANGKIINQRFLYLDRSKVEEKLEAVEDY